MSKRYISEALSKNKELSDPYATVIDIKREQLPTVEEVEKWTGKKFANTLRHIPDHPDYNRNFRQLIHVAYKIAAEMGDGYIHML